MNIDLDVTPLVWHKCIENKRYRRAAEKAMNFYVAKADITQPDGWNDVCYIGGDESTMSPGEYWYNRFSFNSVHFVQDGRIQITLYEW